MHDDRRASRPRAAAPVFTSASMPSRRLLGDGQARRRPRPSPARTIRLIASLLPTRTPTCIGASRPASQRSAASRVPEPLAQRPQLARARRCVGRRVEQMIRRGDDHGLVGFSQGRTTRRRGARRRASTKPTSASKATSASRRRWCSRSSRDGLFECAARHDADQVGQQVLADGEARAMRSGAGWSGRRSTRRWPRRRAAGRRAAAERGRARSGRRRRPTRSKSGTPNASSSSASEALAADCERATRVAAARVEPARASPRRLRGGPATGAGADRFSRSS